MAHHLTSIDRIQFSSASDFQDSLHLSSFQNLKGHKSPLGHAQDPPTEYASVNGFRHGNQQSIKIVPKPNRFPELNSAGSFTTYNESSFIKSRKQSRPSQTSGLNLRGRPLWQNEIKKNVPSPSTYELYDGRNHIRGLPTFSQQTSDRKMSPSSPNQTVHMSILSLNDNAVRKSKPAFGFTHAKQNTLFDACKL